MVNISIIVFQFAFEFGRRNSVKASIDVKMKLQKYVLKKMFRLKMIKEIKTRVDTSRAFPLNTEPCLFIYLMIVPLRKFGAK